MFVVLSTLASCPIATEPSELVLALLPITTLFLPVFVHWVGAPEFITCSVVFAPLPTTTAFSDVTVALAFGPIAIEFVAKAPLLSAFPVSVEFIDTYLNLSCKV